MSAEHDVIGKVLHQRYRLGRLLGQGGMGSVYEAQELRLGRTVAVKILPEELRENPLFVERFRREAESAAMLKHPSIIQITDFLDTPGEPLAMVMELLEGESLLSTVKRGPMPLERARSIVLQLTSALEAAHSVGVIHRDIKPANVFLTPLGGGGDLVTLLDFGIAKLKESEGYSRLTQTGVLIGTPRYASPEQLRGVRTIDARSDLFSVGVLLYGMLAGRPPFRARGAELLVQIQLREPEPLESVRPDLPPAVCQLVRRAMEKSPTDRFQTAAEMTAALRAVEGTSSDAPHEARAAPRLAETRASPAVTRPKAKVTGSTSSEITLPAGMRALAAPRSSSPLPEPAYQRPRADRPSGQPQPHPRLASSPPRVFTASSRGQNRLFKAALVVAALIVVLGAVPMAIAFLYLWSADAGRHDGAARVASASETTADDPECLQWEWRACGCEDRSRCAAVQASLAELGRGTPDRIAHCSRNLMELPRCAHPSRSPRPPDLHDRPGLASRWAWMRAIELGEDCMEWRNRVCFPPATPACQLFNDTMIGSYGLAPGELRPFIEDECVAGAAGLREPPR